AASAPASGATNSAAPAFAAAAATQPNVGGAIILRAADEQARAQVVEFLTALGASTPLIDRTPDHIERPLLDELADPSRYAVVLTGDAQADPARAGRHLFELGVCVGKLGLTRVCVLSQKPESSAYEFGVTSIALDEAGAWHLHLARHLRRGGLEVD